jgi:mannose-6-phosphate isomerase-like protein (cupin superfamily)
MLRKQEHHNIKMSPVCGKIIEILSSRDYPRIDIAIVLDIKPTKAHYHKSFEEIYFVLDGHITLGLYEPKENKYNECILEANELMVIAPGIHHKVMAASDKNRLCVICLPGFDPNDEHLSDKF